jgi:hypothetical protein
MSEVHGIVQQIGDYKVSYGNVFMPRVSLANNEIELPRGCKLYPLKGGQNYIVSTEHYANKATYFFGLDEGLFFTRLSQRSIQPFLQSGEEAFYESLKPWIIREFSQRTTDPPKRQGDIWAIRIADNWDTISQEVLGYPTSPCKEKSGRFNLFNTRHVLDGFMAAAWITTSQKPARRFKKGKAVMKMKGAYVVFGIGTVAAPNHAPMILGDGIYALAQSVGIIPTHFGSGLD